MRILMRFLLTIYLLFMLFISGVMLACTWGLINVSYPQYWLSMLYGNATVQIVVSIIGVVLILLGIMLIFSGIRKRGPKSAVIKTTQSGTISVSLSALEEMATRHVAAHEAVRNARVTSSVKDAKLNISAKLSIADGSNIPEVLSSLQTSLKEHIELLTGIEVNKIQLLVEKTSQVAKARVE